MNKHSLISIDLAKNIFQVCVFDHHQKVSKNVKLSRNKLLDFILKQKADVVAMEACYSSNYWGRLFQQHGLTVRLIPAQHVKPFVRGNKNDKNDALAIGEACYRPNIKTVPVKSIEQQDMRSLHRIRERLLSHRLSLSNQVRGLLSEYGIIMAKGHFAFKTGVAELIQTRNPLVGPLFQQELYNLLDEYHHYQSRLDQINLQITQVAQYNERHQLLMSIPGIGPIISTAIISAIDQGQQFKSASEFAVWLGLTPKQHASGDISYQLGITKRGDRYLRKQLVHGARAAMRWARKRDDQLSQWINQVIARRGYQKANVALAHKLARIIWAMLRDQQTFKHHMN